MIPTLFEIGPFRIHVYGVMLAISFVLGSIWARRAAVRRSIPEDRIFSLVAWILVASIVGARLHYVLAHPEPAGSLLHLFRIWEGGLTLYGGLIAAIVASFLYVGRAKLDFLAVSDAVAPALALGEGITRIGCFLNGCCFGRPHEGFYCVTYPHDSYAFDILGKVSIYPSQLFLSASMFLLFVLLWRLDRAHLTRGLLFGIYLAAQGLVRYLVDFTRYYSEVDRVASLGPWIETKSQVVALVLLLLGLILLLSRLRGPARSPGEADR